MFSVIRLQISRLKHLWSYYILNLNVYYRMKTGMVLISILQNVLDYIAWSTDSILWLSYSDGVKIDLPCVAGQDKIRDPVEKDD